MTATVARGLDKLPTYQWLTAFPQVVSRIGHADVGTYRVLSRIILAVIMAYPLQSIWSMVSVSQSKKHERLSRCQAIFKKVRSARAGADPQFSQTPETPRASSQLAGKNAREVGDLSTFINKAMAMTTELLKLARHEVVKTSSSFSMRRHFPVLQQLAPSPLLIPLQEALTVSLPSSAAALKRHEHNPFPVTTVRFKGQQIIFQIVFLSDTR